MTTASAPVSLPDARLQLASALAAYARATPSQAQLAHEYAELAATDATAASRARLAGHFTGSAFVVSQDGQRTLLLRHAKLGRWLQPGGHADGDFDLARVALREAEEETGLTGLVVQPSIFDLDRHLIPARGAEPEHWHWDVRYLVRATDDETARISAESEGALWREIVALACDEAMDESLGRMARRFCAAG